MDINFTDPNQIKQLITALQALLPEDNNSVNDDEENFKSKIRTKTSRSKKSSHKNLFLDMPEKEMHKSDSAIDKKLSTNPPVPRNRKFTPVGVTCRSCGKQEKVNPAIVPEPKDRYKCNKCSANSGE